MIPFFDAFFYYIILYYHVIFMGLWYVFAFRCQWKWIVSSYPGGDVGTLEVVPVELEDVVVGAPHGQLHDESREVQHSGHDVKVEFLNRNDTKWFRSIPFSREHVFHRLTMAIQETPMRTFVLRPSRWTKIQVRVMIKQMTTTKRNHDVPGRWAGEAQAMQITANNWSKPAPH